MSKSRFPSAVFVKYPYVCWYLLTPFPNINQNPRKPIEFITLGIGRKSWRTWLSRLEQMPPAKQNDAFSHKKKFSRIKETCEIYKSKTTNLEQVASLLFWETDWQSGVAKSLFLEKIVSQSPFFSRQTLCSLVFLTLFSNKKSKSWKTYFKAI